MEPERGNSMTTEERNLKCFVKRASEIRNVGRGTSERSVKDRNTEIQLIKKAFRRLH